MTDTTSPPDVRAQLFAAQHWCAELIGGVSDDRLGDPTPCTEFDVRGLLAHLGVVQTKLVGLAADGCDPYQDHRRDADSLEQGRQAAMSEFVDGRAPQQRAAEARERIERQRAVWTDEVLDGTIQVGWGPVLPGRVVAGIYLMEVLAHGWDLATATGQASEAPEPVAQVGLAFAMQGLPAQPRGIAHGIPFEPPVPSHPDAGPTERLANWTGRVSR